MSITMQMTEACYKAAKLIYPDELKLADAVRAVHKGTEMNKNSARDYIANFFSMLNGEGVKRCMAEADAQYYFEHIYNDYGVEKLDVALNSFQSYLDTDYQNHPGLQELIHRFRQIVEKSRKPVNIYVDRDGRITARTAYKQFEIKMNCQLLSGASNEKEMLCLSDDIFTIWFQNEDSDPDFLGWYHGSDLLIDAARKALESMQLSNKDCEQIHFDSCAESYIRDLVISFSE